MKSDSLVIIPTYNEKENIRNIINAVLALTSRQAGLGNGLYRWIQVGFGAGL